MDRVIGLSKPIVRELRCSIHLDEAHPAKVGQVARNCGLRKAKNVNDVANAKLAGGEHAHDSDAGWIGEPLEHRIESADGDLGSLPSRFSYSQRSHMRHTAYNLARRI